MIQGGFFESKLIAGVYDRSYSASEYAERWRRFVGNGIAIIGGGTLTTENQVSIVTDTMTTQVAIGSGYINGYDYEVSSPEIVTHAAADPTNPRIDRVVIELNLQEATRAFVVKAVTGTPAGSPAAPALTRNDEVWQISLAQVLVPANVVVLNTGTVTDERANAAVCGLANVQLGITPPSGDAEVQKNTITRLVVEDTGVANAYVVNTIGTFDQTQEGNQLNFIPAHTNTGASTIAIDGQTPLVIKDIDDTGAKVDPEAERIQIGRLVRGYIDSGFFVLAPSGGGLAKDFGEGVDGALNTAGNVTITSVLNGPAIIKKYSSININAGHTLTVSNPCQGLVLYSEGDVNINGTIDMSKKAGAAPSANPIPMLIDKDFTETVKQNILLHFNGANGSTSFVDEAGNTWTALGNAQISTALSKFGGASGLFYGVGDYIRSEAPFTFGNQDFIVDFWAKLNDLVKVQDLFHFGYDGQSADKLGLRVRYRGDNKYWYLAVGTGTSFNEVNSSQTSFTTNDNNWHHVAVIRKGTKVSLCIDGIERCFTTQNGEVFRPADSQLIIANGSLSGSNNYYFKGNIDEFRILLGDSFYTIPFAVPNAEYPTTFDLDRIGADKLYKLTDQLRILKGGPGGNGGYGGGSSGSLRSTAGSGGAGRQNLGGFGGGGGGGLSNSPGSGGAGGSILFPELGGGKAQGLYATVGVFGYYIPGRPGFNGGGGTGGYLTSTAFRNTGDGGTCNGGGGGGSGGQAGVNSSNGGDGEYAGGFVLIIAKGNITIGATGQILASGGNGGAGSNGEAGGGGGGGAGGGVVYLAHKGSYINAGAITVNGGTGGAGGKTAGGSKENGAAGTSGGIGKITIQQL